MLEPVPDREIGHTEKPFLVTCIGVKKEGELFTLVLKDRDKLKVTAHLTGSSICILVGELNEILERENALRRSWRTKGGDRAAIHGSNR